MTVPLLFLFGYVIYHSMLETINGSKGKKECPIMRRDDKLNIQNEMVRKLASVHFHEFIEKESVLSDVELSQEMGLSLREIRLLKRKLGR